MSTPTNEKGWPAKHVLTCAEAAGRVVGLSEGASKEADRYRDLFKRHTAKAEDCEKRAKARMDAADEARKQGNFKLAADLEDAGRALYDAYDAHRMAARAYEDAKAACLSAVSRYSDVEAICRSGMSLADEEAKTHPKA